ATPLHETGIPQSETVVELEPLPQDVIEAQLQHCNEVEERMLNKGHNDATPQHETGIPQSETVVELEPLPQDVIEAQLQHCNEVEERMLNKGQNDATPQHEAGIPEPQVEPQPQAHIPQSETVVELEPLPQDVIEAQLQHCNEVEERIEADIQVQACEEAEAQMQSSKHAHIQASKPEPVMQAILEVCRFVNNEVIEARVETAAVATGDVFDAPTFDLGIDDPNDFLETDNPVTPVAPVQVPMQEQNQITEDLKKKCVIWTLSKKKEIKYEIIFKLKGDLNYEGARSHFRSMREGKKIDITVITIMSLILNREPLNIFQNEVYIMPPDVLTTMFGIYKEKFTNPATNRPFLITECENMKEHLKLVDKQKLQTHPYIFAPVLYQEHWWMYILDVLHRRFYVVDSKKITCPSSDRRNMNRFAGNIIDQVMVYAGTSSLLLKETKTRPRQVSLFPRYIEINQQPNDYDCGTFVMKWMDVLDPTKLDESNPYPIDVWTTEELQGFRGEMILRMILSKENLYIDKAIEGANSIRIQKPSAALQSPFLQVSTGDLKS
ncbi:hypothetical protein PIB30_091150, partial [Stylosanthes scabra]|nr:hypothetical protein [Stylosanthes scabra]